MGQITRHADSKLATSIVVVTAVRLGRKKKVYILCGCAERLPVGDVRVPGLDALDLVPAVHAASSTHLLARRR
jgi:hypothetical protein